MEIIDAQVHFGPSGLNEIIPIMNALGIAGAVLDEYWGYKHKPGHALPGDKWRLSSPCAEIISTKHPDRFSYLQRIEIDDPELPALIRLLGDAPAARAVRVTPGLTAAELKAFGSGQYRKAFALAVDAGLAIFVMVQGHVELLKPYLTEFPDGRFVIDHCGMPLEAALRRPGSSIDVAAGPGENYEYFQEVLKLADHPNAALKWAHAQGIFGEDIFPFSGLSRYLRRAIDAFGMQRVIWASDATVIPDNNWGDLLHFVKSNVDLSREEKEWVLGKAIRAWIRWS